ncbi:MAG: hypothetical protein HY922_03755 [Elusimicrobia bacterium]|nr:hypothetical protein [Elusimicrobiota bacterium]
MMRGCVKLIAAALLAVLPASAHAANGFKALAKALAQATEGLGVERVAVLPFEPADGSSASEGWNISEKLITQIVKQGKLQAVERSLLKKLMGEHLLGRTGVLDPSTLRMVGRVFGVDAVVTGTFITLGSEAVVQARFISVETGVIMAAEEQKVEREWLAPLGAAMGSGGASEDAFLAPVPTLTVSPPPFPVMDRELAELRDSPAESVCVDAAERVDRLERQILDLKARYWALKLRAGFDRTAVKQNPGSTITDPLLKKAFYDRMKAWYERDRIPKLTRLEVERFVELDEKAYTLHRRCGL